MKHKNIFMPILVFSICFSFFVSFCYGAQVPDANSIDSMQSWHLQSRPGETYAYSNANYWLLSYLVDEISGVEFPEYLRQEVFMPLEMTNSLSTVHTGDKVEGLANGHVSAYGKALP